MTNSGPVPNRRAGDELAPRQYTLDGEYGADYGERTGDDIGLYRREGFVHPAVWPAIANNVFHTDLVRGSWIHTRSNIRHHGVGPVGAVVDVMTRVVERFERHGERAVADVRIELDGRPLATIEHEAIIALAK